MPTPAPQVPEYLRSTLPRAAVPQLRLQLHPRLWHPHPHPLGSRALALFSFHCVYQRASIYFNVALATDTPSPSPFPSLPLCLALSCAYLALLSAFGLFHLPGSFCRCKTFARSYQFAHISHTDTHTHTHPLSLSHSRNQLFSLRRLRCYCARRVAHASWTKRVANHQQRQHQQQQQQRQTTPGQAHHHNHSTLPLCRLPPLAPVWLCCCRCCGCGWWIASIISFAIVDF